jgi:hypothetical protein
MTLNEVFFKSILNIFPPSMRAIQLPLGCTKKYRSRSQLVYPFLNIVLQARKEDPTLFRYLVPAFTILLLAAALKAFKNFFVCTSFKV